MIKKEKRRNSLIILLFLIGIFIVKLLWVYYFTSEDSPDIRNGQLDLSDYTLAREEPFTLDGEWSFSPYQLYDDHPAKNTVPIKVPSHWNTTLNPSSKEAYGYGSYHLTITVAPSNQLYTLYFPSVRSAATVFVNGEKLYQAGQVATTKASYEADNIPFTVSFKAPDGQIHIAVDVANYLDPRGGGIVRSVKFGANSEVFSAINVANSIQLLTNMVFLTLACLSILLYIIGVRDKRLLYFAGAAFAISIFMSILNEEKILAKLLQLSYTHGFILVNITQLFLAVMLIQLGRIDCSAKCYRYSQYYIYIGALLTLPIVLLPLHLVITMSPIFSAYLGIAFLWLLIRLTYKERHYMQRTLLIRLVITGILHHLLWSVYFMYTGIKVLFFPFDILLPLLLLTALWLKRYHEIYIQKIELTEQLHHANQLKDEFLANTSHELRNPLHSILALTETVMQREKETLSSTSQHNLQLMMAVGKRMRLLLDDLLDMSYLQHGQPKLNTGKVRIQAQINGIMDMLTPIQGAKKLTFHNNIPSFLPAVYADENRVIQILFNLLHNAFKYTEHGNVTIDAYQVDDYIKVTVQDTGIGIDEATLAKIFTPYERSQEAIAMANGGFGLGLNISRNLALIQGGDLSVHTSHEGSTFTLTLPLYVGEDQQVAAPSPAPVICMDNEATPLSTATSSFTKGRILLIDDDPINLHVIQQILIEDGHEVITSLNGLKALSLVRKHHIDLVICDVMMPRISGYELTKQLRAHYSLTELPILLLTARTQTEDLTTGFKSGANDYVVKPVDITELRVRSNALLTVKKSLQDHLQLEASWLQTQIQPHFFFNTLNTILSLNVIDRNRMDEVLEAFTTFLRSKFKFTHFTQEIPLQEEIDLVKSYLFIEQQRYENRLHVKWQVATTDAFILPLTIQPLVDNAIRHSIIKKPEGGTLTIIIREQPTTLHVTIQDDGIGMDQTFADQLLTRNFSSQHGIGLINTNMRLTKKYGEGLQITSALHQGTTITFKLPKNKA